MISCNLQRLPFHSIAFKAIVFCGTSGELPLWNQATFYSQIRERNGRGGRFPTSSPGRFSLALGPAPKAREKRPGDEVGRFQKSLVESLFAFPLGSPSAFVSFLPRRLWLALYHLFIRCITITTYLHKRA